MLTLAQLGDRTNLPVRRLQYVCDHAVVPGVSGKGQGFGVARTFTDVEAFGLATAAHLLQAGCVRRVVTAALRMACMLGRATGSQVADTPLSRAWLATTASLEIGDGYVVRLRGQGRLGVMNDFDTGWLPLHPQGLRLRLLDPVVSTRVDLAQIATAIRTTHGLV